MNTILLIEDSLEYQNLVSKILSNYNILKADDAEEAFELVKDNPIDLILLDLILPRKDGYTVLSELQADKHYSTIPVICLTGKLNVVDKVAAFSLGADDYIMKPFDPIEFKARVDSRISKTKRQQEKKETQQIGNITIDISGHKVTGINGRDIPLTQTEFKILKCLSKYAGNVLSREQLITSVWGNNSAIFDRAVDVHICSLRKKIKNANLNIKAITGVGYKLHIHEI